MLLISLVVALIYSTALDGPLFFDDKPALTNNELVQISGNIFDDWRIASQSSNSGPLGRPIAMLSFAANHALANGFVNWQLKLVNLIIHFGCGFLIYRLFTILVSSRTLPDWLNRQASAIAILGAAIWLLHPLHVSTVLYTVQRMTQLSAFFALSGLVIFFAARIRWSENGADVGELLAMGLWLGLFTFLASFSKENGALLPWLVVVTEATLFKGQWKGRYYRRLSVFSWILCLLPVLVIIWMTWFGDFIQRGYDAREFSLEERLLTQARMIWHYLFWILLPDVTAMGFHHDDIPWSTDWFTPITTIAAVIGLLFALIAAIALRNRFPLLLFGLLFFLVGHSMESSVLPLEMVYEHRNYLPSVGVCIIAAACLAWLSRSIGRRSGVLIGAGVISVLAVSLAIRVQAWASEPALMRSEVMNHPESARANFFYANALLENYKNQSSLQLSDAEARNNLLGARHYFERMYQEDPDDLAALVLLLALDEAFFPELLAIVDWMPQIEKVISDKPLQASDYAALYSLVDCFTREICRADDSWLLGVLNATIHRHPEHVEVALLKYSFLKSRGAEPRKLKQLLEEIIDRQPGAIEAYFHAASEASLTRSYGEVYEYLLKLMREDEGRLQLGRLRQVFLDRGVNE